LVLVYHKDTLFLFSIHYFLKYLAFCFPRVACVPRIEEK